MIQDRPTVLLINPPIYDFALFDLYHKPYGLSRIGQWFQDAGYNVDVADAMDYRDQESNRRLGSPKRNLDGTGHFHRQVVPTPDPLYAMERTYARYGIIRERLEELVRTSIPDLVLMSTGMTYWYPGAHEAIDVVRRVHPHVPVIIGGIYATCMPEHARGALGPDLIIRGSDLSPLRSFLQRNGYPVPSGSPAYGTLLSMGNPRDAWAVKLNEGCPYSCDYCASPVLAPVFAAGDAARAAEQVMHVQDLLGTTHFAFYDDAILTRAENVLLPFLEVISSQGRNIRFHLPNALHGSMLTPEIANALSRAGFTEVRIGFESPDPLFHRKHKGKPGVSDFSEVVDILRTAGFAPDQIIPYVLAGLPDQLPEEIEGAIRYCFDLGIKPSIAEYSPIPGSVLWGESVARCDFPIEDEPLFQNNSFFAMRSSRFSMDDMARLKRLSHSVELS